MACGLHRFVSRVSDARPEFLKSAKLDDYNFTPLRTGEYSIYRGGAGGQDPVLLFVPRDERRPLELVT